MNLNWRHKAGLFLAVTATGIGLLLELSAKQTAGIALLGIAFAWLCGSLAVRTLGLATLVLISTVGLYVAAAPMWEYWRSFRESANDYDSAITELQLAVKNAQLPVTLDLSKSQQLEDASPPPAGKPPQQQQTKREGQKITPPPPGFVPENSQRPIDSSKYQGRRRVQVPEDVKKWISVPMFAPDGRVRAVPYYSLSDALAAGGKRAVKMADPQGTLRWVPLDEVDAAEKAGGTVKDDWFANRLHIVDSRPIGSANKVDYAAIAKQYGAISSTPPPPEFIPESTPAFSLFFPNDMSDPDIMRKFETEILRPRPTLSLTTALGSHNRWLFLIGLTLFVSSLLGFISLLQHGRKTSQDSAEGCAGWPGHPQKC